MKSSPALESGMRRRGFSLIELMVVIGIIALLIGLIMPIMSGARRAAKNVQCKTNLRTLGQMLQIYQGENRGWLFPVGVNEMTGLPSSSFGINRPPHERWPMKVFKIPAAPLPPAYDSDAYTQNPYEPDVYPAGPYTPEALRCPSDVDPYEAHSYVLNSHLADRAIKAGKSNFGGLTNSEVIVAGEKFTLKRDYYMQNQEFFEVVDRFRHGMTLGSNYLYFDGHVGTVLPSEAMSGIDPWDLRTPVPEEMP